MRCSQCDYVLWDLRDRRCPECGFPFVPSDFDLVPSSVKFCCPACDQPYYGTTHRGHLHPAEFECVRCGRRLHMDEMVMRPAEGVASDHTVRERNPWLDQRRSWIGRLLGAIGNALVRPGEMARVTPMSASLGRAFLFALIVNSIAAAVFTAPQTFLAAFGGPVLLGAALVWLAALVATLTIGAFAWGLTAHIILRCTGRTHGTLRHTMLAMHYGAGANITMSMWCFGPILGTIWWAISAGAMLAEFHRVSAWRAALAVLLLPIVAVGGMITFQWMAFTAAMNAAAQRQGAFAGAMATIQNSTPAGRAGSLAIGMQFAARRDNGRLPDHPGRLLANRDISPSVASPDGMTLGPSITIGGRPLSDLDTLPPGQRLGPFDAAITAELRANPDATAWRVGCIVGLDLSGVSVSDAASQGLWLGVICDDPDTVPPGGPPLEFWVVERGGASRLITDQAAATALRDQNARRDTLGLRPIPDPRQVRHWRPPGP